MANMHLYALTLQPTTGIVSAVYGNFSAPKAQEIVVNRGHSLELLRLDETGKPQSVLLTDAFGIVRAIHPFRLIGLLFCLGTLLDSQLMALLHSPQRR